MSRLTLRLDEALILRSKAYARRTGKSVSDLVAGFFDRLDSPTERSTADVVVRSAAVRSLIGALARARVSEADYRSRLVEKQRTLPP